jgi:hypothetical protein
MLGKVACCVVALMMLIPTVASSGVKVFSVQPSTSIQSANLGFQKGRLTPYIGLDLVMIDVDLKDNGHDESSSAVVMLPTLGARYALSNGDLQPYLFGNVFKSLAFLSSDNWYDDDEDLIEDLLGLWGFDIGFGVDYPFSEHFSIAGQYGLRLVFAGAENRYDEELSAMLGLTHAEVALRFTFGQ